MSRRYAISIVLLIWFLGLGVGLWMARWWGQPGAVEPTVTGSGPREERRWQRAQPKTVGPEGISDAEFAAKIEQVSRQVGAGFRTAIVKPFVVTSNQSAEDFEVTCRHTIRWAVQMLNKDFFSREPNKIITIYLFRDKESYRKYAWSLFAEQPTTPYGYYSPEHQALVMNIGTGGGTLVHEIVHPLLAADFPAAPSWFDEGLASLYEQSHQRDGQIAGLLNWRLPVLKDGLRAGHFVPLQQLLSTSREEFYEDPQGMHYAEARYLCYYLQEKHLLRKFYREFKKNHSADPTGIKTLLKVTGKDSLKQLETQWLEFLTPLSYKR